LHSSRSGGIIAEPCGAGPLYKARSGGFSLNVYAIRPDGTGLVKLTHSTGGTVHDQAGAWSPDGRKIAFKRCSNCNGDQMIYTMNADGAHVKELTPGDVPVSWGSHP